MSSPATPACTCGRWGCCYARFGAPPPSPIPILLPLQLVMTMMLAHLSDEPYHPFGKTLAGFLALGVHGIVVYVMVGVNESWEDLVLYELAGAMLVSYVHMVTSMVCRE
eukprot:Sspe_Gene.34370::Locus_16712_Transcript_8_9_Confidence_0.640_Length_839::g.34370::m.34370